MTIRTRTLAVLVSVVLAAAVSTVAFSLRSTGNDLDVLGSVQGEPTMLVSSNGSIQSAVDAASAGDIIGVPAGTYAPFVVSNKRDLTVVAQPGARIQDGRYDRTAAIQILDSANVTIQGFEIRSTLFGVMVKRSTDTVLRALDIADIGQEGILVRDFSRGALIEDSVIRDTGRRPGSDSRFAYSVYGEGIYLGTGNYPGDATSGVVIRNNDISRTTAEAIDVKAYVSDVVIEGNRVHDVDTNTSGAIVVGIGTWSYPRSSVTIENNLIWNISSNSPWQDGNGITASADAVIRGNVIWDTEHYGILLDGNFRTSDTEVVVESNAIFAAGVTEVGRRTSPNPGQLSVAENLIGADAIAVLAGSQPLSNGQPAPALMSLLSSVSGTDPVAVPAPTEVPVTSTTPTTSATAPSSSVPNTPTTTSPATTSTTASGNQTESGGVSNPAATSEATTRPPSTAPKTSAVEGTTTSAPVQTTFVDGKPTAQDSNFLTANDSGPENNAENRDVAVPSDLEASQRGDAEGDVGLDGSASAIGPADGFEPDASADDVTSAASTDVSARSEETIGQVEAQGGHLLLGITIASLLATLSVSLWLTARLRHS